MPDRIFRPTLTLFCLMLCIHMQSMLSQNSGHIHRSLSQLIQNVWTTQNGLPQNAVNDLVQTRDGYLWIATQEGVARFDGVRFTVYDRRMSRTLPSNHVSVLLEDSSGTLWLGTNSGLARIKAGKFVEGTPILFGHIIRSVQCDTSGVIWVATTRGLYSIVGDSAMPATLPGGKNISGVRSLRSSRNGGLWIGTESDGIYHWIGSTLNHFAPGIGISRFPVNAIFEDGFGRIWVGLNGGGIWYSENSRFVQARTGAANNTENIFAFFEDKGSDLWVGASDGLMRIHREKRPLSIERFESVPGISGQTIYSILIDREGSMWVGTFARGLSQFVLGSFVTHGVDDGRIDRFVFCVFEDSQRRIWVGTDGGGVSVLSRDRKQKTYTTANGLPNNGIFAITEDDRGYIWLGTSGGGVVEFRDGVRHVYNTDNGLPSNFIRALASDTEGYVWVGTREGICRMRDGLIEYFSEKHGVTSQYIRTIYVDRSGTVWAGTFGGGVLRYADGMFRSLTTADGLSSNDVWSIYEDSTGVMWFGTDGGGIVRYANGKLDPITTVQGMHDDVVLTILPDDEENFWLSSNRGVARVSRAELISVADGRQAKVNPMAFGRSDGMKSEECNGGQPAGVRAADGRLWFPTILGVASINPRQLRKNTLPPPVVIEAILADEVELPLSNVVTIPAGTKRVEVNFAGLSFLSPQRVSFQFRLDGLDNTWIDGGTRRSTLYTSLSPGNYRFRVRARNADGVLNEEGTSISVVADAFFYETTWFITLMVASFAGTAAGVYGGRFRRLQRRHRDLEGLVKVRTHDLQHQISISSEANEFKTQLLDLAAHDLKSPLISIRGFAQILRDDPNTSENMRTSLASIHYLSQSMLNLINELLDASAIEQGKIQLALKRVDLASIVSSVVDLHRVTARRKMQTVIFEPSPSGTCMVNVDVGRMHTIVENLVSNAIKFSGHGTTIHVSVSKVGDVSRVSVTDEGPGLTPDDQRRLFGRFQKLSARPTAGEGSSGLGLSIVKQLVELHGGRVYVESLHGHGSTFILEIPCVS